MYDKCFYEYTYVYSGDEHENMPHNCVLNLVIERNIVSFFHCEYHEIKLTHILNGVLADFSAVSIQYEHIYKQT